MDAGSRSEIEKRLIGKGERLRRGEEGCYDVGELEDYFIVWRELTTHFEDHDDSCLDVEVVREYLSSLTAFANGWQNESFSDSCREQSGEAVYELEMALNDIIKVVEARRYPDGR